MNWWWQVDFYEAGANRPYCRRLFYSRAGLEAALRLFSRLGGDDILKIIDAKGILFAKRGRPAKRLNDRRM